MSSPIKESSMDLTAIHSTNFNTLSHYVLTTCDDDFIGSAGSAPMTLADGSTVTTETPAATETLTGSIGDISPQTNDSFSLTDTNGGMTDTSPGGGTFTAGDASTEGDSGIAASVQQTQHSRAYDVYRNPCSSPTRNTLKCL